MYFIYNTLLVSEYTSAEHYATLNTLKTIDFNMNTPIKEWDIEAPWGNISLTSWGNPDAPPVFLAHGRQDCSATFQPILQLLPGGEYHYVVIDMPGSGKSTHLPIDNNHERMEESGPHNTLPNTSAPILEVVEMSEDGEKATHNKDTHHQILDQARSNTLSNEISTQNSLIQDQSTSASASERGLTAGSLQNLINLEEASSINAGNNRLLTTASARNLMNQEQAAQAAVNDKIDFTAIKADRFYYSRPCEVVLPDIALQVNKAKEKSVTDTKADYVVVDIGDTEEVVGEKKTVTTIEEAGYLYTIFEVDPNGNLPSYANSNVNVAYNDMNWCNLSCHLNDGSDNDKEEILETNNKHLLKTGDIIFHEELGHSFRILWCESMQSFCVKLFPNAETDVRGQRSYRIVKNSSIRFIAMSDNDGSSQAEQVQNTFEPISYVPSNSPQESDSERQKSPFNAISVDVDLASQMFERMNMPPLTPENALDRDEETFVFPKYIKCNDYGVGGTCPFAVKQSAFHAPTRRCNMHSQDITGNKAIMATSSYSNPKIIVNDEDGDDAVDVVATKADTPIDEEIFVGTEDTTKQTTQIDSATNSPSEKKDLMTAEYSGKRVKFDAQANSPKRGRSRQRRANRHRDGGTACLCVCLPLQGRGPLNWLVDRLQRCLKRKTAQRQSIVWHPRRIRNVYVDARYYQTQGEYPILFIPSLAVPFSTDSYHLHPIPEYNPLNVTTECCEEDDAYGPYQTPNARRGIERNEAYWTQNGQFYEDYLPTYHYHPILSRQMPSAYNTNMGQYGEPRNYVAPIDIPSTSTAPPVEMGQCVQPHPINPTMIQPLRGMRAPTPRMDQYGQLRLINPPAYTTTMAPDMLPDSLHHHHHHHSKSTLNVHQELSSRCNKDIRTGVKIMRFHFLGAVEVAIEHLGWEKFIFIGHSMGCELGLFYNAIHPGKITKMIFFDAELTLRRLQVQDLAEYQAKFYDYYYDNYMKENYHVKTYTKPQAVQALIRARKLPEDKAAIIVSKSLIHVKDDQYKFSWGNRLKFPAPQNYPNTYYFALFRTIPPTILISATETLENRTKYSAGSLELIKMMETLKNFHHVVVEGNHDVHLIHPERVAPYVNDFLRKTTVSSKL